MKAIIVIWRCWFYLLTSFLVVTIGLFWVFPLSIFQKTSHIAFWGIRLWAFLIFYGTGFSYQLNERDKIKAYKNLPHIIISNHTSQLDIMLMILLAKNNPIIFVGKAELAKAPIFGTIYKRISILVDRSNQKSKAAVFPNSKKRIQEGNSIVIFPEGGVPDDESVTLAPFKDGAFSIAIHSQIPIKVYAFCGLKNMFPFSWTRGFPGKVKVDLLDVVETKGLSLNDKQELKEKCYQLIYNKLKQCEQH